MKQIRKPVGDRKMTPNEYLDATKKAMGVTADNELANRFEIHRARICAYRAGKEWPDNYIITKMAITLNLDPAKVLADLESQREKNPKRAEFWKSFLSQTIRSIVWPPDQGGHEARPPCPRKSPARRKQRAARAQRGCFAIRTKVWRYGRFSRKGGDVCSRTALPIEIAPASLPQEGPCKGLQQAFVSQTR